MEGVNTYLDPPDLANVSSGRAGEKETKSFAFDKSYWFVGLFRAKPLEGES